MAGAEFFCGEKTLFRIGFFTDTHLVTKRFMSRSDDFVKTALEKLSFCLKRCSTSCDLTLFGGDLTDRYRLTDDKVKERIICSFYENLVDDHCFCYTYGQHDLHGKDYEHREDSTTSFVMKLLRLMGKNVNELPVDHDVELEVGGKKILVTACPNNLDPVEWSREAVQRRPERADIRIAVVHHLVSNVKAGWYVNVDDIVTAVDGVRSIDVVLCGDLHDGFEACHNRYGTLFVNPGSVARTKKTKKDFDREVRGVDIIVNDDNTFSHEYWKVDTARPSREVFIEEQPFVETDEVDRLYKESNEQDTSYDAVIERLSKIKQQKMSVWDVLPVKARELNVDREVFDYILSKK